MNNKISSVIYILTNPSFPEYVKIGYADDIDKRLKELNRSECIPYAFRLYAYYKVPVRLTDLKIHKMIDNINPNLRSIEEFNGKTRRREFYAMSAADAYLILESIASINGLEENLVLVQETEHQLKDEEQAEKIRVKGSIPRLDWMIEQNLLKRDDEIYVISNPNEVAKIIDGSNVQYKDKQISLNTFAKTVTGSKSICAYKYVREVKSKKTLDELRKNRMKELGMIND